MTGLRTARPNAIALVVGAYLLTFAAGAVAVGTGVASRPVTAAVIGLCTGAVMLFGVHRHRPPARWPWWLLALAVVTFMVSRNAPPAVADALYLGVVFPSTAAGLTRLGRRGPDGIRTLDALTVSAGLAVLSWVLLIAPVLRNPDLSMGAMAVGVARPLADIAMLACLVRALLGTRLRPAGALLCGGMLALIAQELLTDRLTDSGLWSGGTQVRWLGGVFCGLWGLGALHPSMVGLSTATAERGLLGRGRLVLLAASSLTAPAVLLVEGMRGTVDDPQVIAVSSAILFLLVLTRLAGVLTVHRQTAARERALRAAAAALLTTTSREGVFDAVRTAVGRLLPPDTPHEATLGVDRTAGLPPPPSVARTADGGGSATEGLGGGFAVEGLGADSTAGGSGSTVSSGGVVRIPVPVRDGSSVSLTVTAAEETLAALGDALQVLASHAALALARVSLNGEVNHRRSEEYFRTLVQNASDVILIVDDDDRIRYASPSAARLFGATPPVGHAVTELTAQASRELATRYLRAARAGGIPQQACAGPGWAADRTAAGEPDPRAGTDRTAGNAVDAGGAGGAGGAGEAGEAGAVVGTRAMSGSDVVAASRAARPGAGRAAGVVGAVPAGLLPGGDWQVGALPTGDGRIVEPIDVEVSVRDLRDDPTVGGLVLTLRDVTEPRRLERELTHHAFSDALTGLANRALFQERLKQALARAERNGTVVAVLCADFDDFAIINDTIGHEAGDQLVIAAGRRIGTLVAPHATVARSGGDEFSVLVEDVTSAREVEQIAEKIVSGFTEPFRLAAGTVSGAVSVGVAVAGESESAIRIEDPTALVREADLALYLAKGAGKGRWRRFQASLHAHMRERLELRADLDRALADGAFELYYQPIVDLPTGRALGFEALLRWPHPTRGFVPPDRFIGIAEESGQIVAIGSLVLERALDTAAVWRDRDGPDAPYVSVNVSARQFRTPGFVDRVMRGLASRRLPASSLVLEITESLLLRDDDGVLADLAALRDEGVRIAIDDFGTGYSSLSYLRQVPADLLKIDKSFVDTVVASKEQRALVEAIVTLAHTLGLRVVVEGIERSDERALLTALGCEYGQGYLFSRPMSYADVNRWIAVDRVAA